MALAQNFVFVEIYIKTRMNQTQIVDILKA